MSDNLNPSGGTSVMKKSWSMRMLEALERAGNKLPDPVIIFIWLGAIILVLSAIGEALGWQAVNPATNETIRAVSLLNGPGIRKVVENVTRNLANFGPFTAIITIMIGVGIADGTGLLKTLMVKSVSRLPRWAVTTAIVFIGLNSNVASDTGFVALPPIAAIIFISMGRHPFIGIAAAFGSTAAGFNACLLPVSGDVIVAAMTEAAAAIIDPTIMVNPLVNYYIMAFSVIPLTIVMTLVVEKVIAPRFQDVSGINMQVGSITDITPEQNRGLRNAGIALALTLGVIFLGAIPGGPLRNEQGGLLPSALINASVFWMFLCFVIPGIVYGKTVGVIKKDTDGVKFAASGVVTVAGYVVLAFVAAQFLTWFAWSNLGVLMAINGAMFLQLIGLTGLPLAIGVTVLVAFINLFMGSQTAKWALVSTVLVPMLMLMDFHPTFTLAIYRIGDSVTNGLSPLFPYFPVLVGFLVHYDKKAGMGTAFSLMLPICIAAYIVFLGVLIPWFLLDLPLGPAGMIWMP